MTDRDLPTGTEDEGKTLDMPEGMKGFAPGQVLGERYQVLEMLGRGGMGEVWHAFDLEAAGRGGAEGIAARVLQVREAVGTVAAGSPRRS